jgi:hypothetical protein
MVPVGEWQWQYWLSCGGLKKGWENEKKMEFVMAVGTVCLSSGLGSGSGWLQLVPLERGGQGGSNGTSCNVAVAVLAELWRIDSCCCH